MATRLEPGLQLSDALQLDRRLGEGTSTDVWAAVDVTAGLWRAVKFLVPPTRTVEPELVERFVEALAPWSALQHPHVVTLHGHGRTEDLLWIALDLVDGGSVHDWIRRYGALPPRRALGVALSACAGLAHAHEHGATHGDLRPRNLLVARDGQVRVTDFGLRGLVDGARLQSLISLGIVAPEQVAGNAEPRSDVYGFGALLHTLLTARAPDPPDRVGEELHPVLADLIRRAMEPALDRRIPSMVALYTEVSAAVDQLPPDDRDPPPLLDPDLLPLPPIAGLERRNRGRGKALLERARAAATPLPEATPPHRSTLTSGVDRNYRPRRGLDPRIPMVVAGTLGLVFLLLLSAVLGNRMTVASRERQERVATEAILAVTEAQAAIVERLGPELLARFAEEQQAFAAVSRAADAEARVVAARRAADLLRADLADLERRDVPSEKHAVLGLREALRRIDEALLLQAEAAARRREAGCGGWSRSS